MVNKADSARLREYATDFYELGMGDPYPISSLHGTGTGDLLDDLVASLPVDEDQEDDESIKIAIVGKPNVGKSSLLNRLLGKERAIVVPSLVPAGTPPPPNWNLTAYPLRLSIRPASAGAVESTRRGKIKRGALHGAH